MSLVAYLLWLRLLRLHLQAMERAKIFGGLRCLGSRDMNAPRRLPPCLAAAPALPAPLVPLLGAMLLQP